jgi:hypothetical protein
MLLKPLPRELHTMGLWVFGLGDDGCDELCGDGERFGFADHHHRLGFFLHLF